MLATPTLIRCDRCRVARSQAVMARGRHVAGRESEWTCPECASVWAFVSEPTTESVDAHVIALQPSVCPCPLGGPLEVAREVGTRGAARGWLWVCAGCGAGHPISRVASA
jgi:predicted Rossmann-fold nucleotide-binding protein